MPDRIHLHFLERGILLRPLGNEIYIVPPYCTSTEDLERVYEEILRFAELYGGS
jgi:adenosylmethionine-8-amino-7-oxononanoate aminotransferase